MNTDRALEILNDFTGYTVISNGENLDKLPTDDEMLEAVRLAVESLKKEINK